MSTSQQDDYQRYITDNVVELVQQLRVSAIIDHLLSHRLVTIEEGRKLRQCSTEQDGARMLFYDILESKGNDVVGRLCDVLVAAGQQHLVTEVMRKEVGQPHIVKRPTTTGNTQGTPRDPQVAAAGVGEMEMLQYQVVQLDREKRKVTVQLEEERKRVEEERKRAEDAQKEKRTAREEMRKAKEETSQARQETGQAKQEMKEAKIETKGERLKIMALEYEKSRGPASHHHQINDSLSSWSQWNVCIPHDSWECNSMGEIEDRLVVGGYDDSLRVLTYEHDKWDKFARKNGYISNVVCHQDVCLVCVVDLDKNQLVIEQFFLNEDKKWRFLTVLPKELQLDGVSVALHDNSLYVVGGETESGETVNTAHVCDLHSGHWSKMDDMQTKRSDCSSVIINNTVFVGGGLTDGTCYSNIVECADVRDRKWRTISSTTTYNSTLTSVSNRLVGTGGLTRQGLGPRVPSNIVELYDERSTKWLPLPLMTHKRCFHAAFSTQNGELITAGGEGAEYSIESLKCD